MCGSHVFVLLRRGAQLAVTNTELLGRIHSGHGRPQPSPAAAAAIGGDKQCGVYRNNQAGVGCLIKGGEQRSTVQCRAS